MAITNYVRSVANDTLNGTVSLSELDQSIRDSGITIALEGIDVVGDVLTITFKDALSTANETILDNTLSAHDGLSLDNEIVTTKILEESLDPSKRTGGHFKATTIDIDIPATVGVHVFTWSFPYNISMLSIEYVGYAENKDDVFSVCVAPNTIVGAITGNIVTDDVVINVQQSVVDNTFIGMKCNVTTDPVNGSDANDLGYIIGIDKVNNTITVSNAAVDGFDATSPTYVRIAVEPVKDVKIDVTTAPVQVGGSKIGGSFVAANTTFMCHYDNKDGVAKNFHAIMELLY